MELDELKDIWKEENNKLENRIKLNENLIEKMNVDKTIGTYDKLLKQSLVGRNLALVYCGISIWMALIVIKEIEYSIPAIIGALAMLWSFISHLSIEKSDYGKISLVELQKSICKFRIHTATMAKYDSSIVFLWLLTLAPIFIKIFYNISIYSNFKYLSVFCLFSFVFIILIWVLGHYVYQKYERQLKQSEADLNEIIEFEKM